MKDNDPLPHRPVSVPTRTLSDGTLVWPVPSQTIPADRVSVFGHSTAEQPQRVLDICFTLPRDEIQEYAVFLARHGAIDREPTDDEINTLMQLAGNQMVEWQTELFGRFSEFLIDRLGSGDRTAAREACTDSIAATITAEAIKANAIPPEEADETRELIRKAIEAMARRMADGASDQINGNREGGDQ